MKKSENTLKIKGNKNLYKIYYNKEMEGKMNILAVGDIVGQVGVKELQKRMPKIKEEYKIDFTIVNGENAADRNGTYRKVF